MHPTKINYVDELFSLDFENAMRCESIQTLLKIGLFGAAHDWRGDDETRQLYVT